MIELYNHQKNILTVSRDKEVYAWFLETGTGKTILAIENIYHLWIEGKIDAALITSPKTVIKPVWMKIFRDNYINEFKFYLLPWIGGFTNDQERVFTGLMKHDNKLNRMPILLANIEAFSHKRIQPYIKMFCTRFRTIWIMDESTTIKSPQADRTKKVLDLSHLPKYKRILSGFPILKSPEDLYTQITFLGQKLSGHKSFYSFRNMYTIVKQLDNRITISLGPKNSNKLQQLLQPFSSRVLKKDCLDLPDKVRTQRFIEMSREQKEMYVKMKKEGYVTLKETNAKIFASTLLAQLEKLHQIANGFLTPNYIVDTDKYELLLNIIKNEVDGQCVIWSHYTHNIEAIFGYLVKQDIPCDIIYGATSMKDRDYSLKKFDEGKIQCLIANPATIMHGLTLVTAHYAIYFNNSFSLEHRIQSEDRLHRIGQVNKVTYIDLITENTIEERVLQTLENKHSVGAASLGDEWENWFN